MVHELRDPIESKRIKLSQGKTTRFCEGDISQGYVQCADLARCTELEDDDAILVADNADTMYFKKNVSTQEFERPEPVPTIQAAGTGSALHALVLEPDLGQLNAALAKPTASKDLVPKNVLLNPAA